MSEKKKILVVEDNELNMKLVVALLKMGQYEPMKAGDAETCIEMARDINPDLILMDIYLPGMDGLEATKELRKYKEFKDTPIIALTSYAMAGEEYKALEAGCDGYIPKPINTRNFLEYMSGYFNDSQD